jgi:hypothetical protein
MVLLGKAFPGVHSIKSNEIASEFQPLSPRYDTKESLEHHKQNACHFQAPELSSEGPKGEYPIRLSFLSQTPLPPISAEKFPKVPRSMILVSTKQTLLSVSHKYPT